MGIGATDKNRSLFLKGFNLSRSGENEDPTYLGFKFVFDFGSLPVNLEYGWAPSPLLRVPNYTTTDGAANMPQNMFGQPQYGFTSTNVVLPPPLRPTTPIRSPAITPRVTSSRTVRVPYTTVMPSIASSGLVLTAVAPPVPVRWRAALCRTPLTPSVKPRYRWLGPRSQPGRHTMGRCRTPLPI